jgi:hypothetical protein
MCTSSEFKRAGGVKKYENKAKVLGCLDGYSSVLEEEIERERQKEIYKSKPWGKTSDFF